MNNVEMEEVKKLIKEVLNEERQKGNITSQTGALTKEEIYNELIMPVDTNIKLSSVIL